MPVATTCPPRPPSVRQLAVGAARSEYVASRRRAVEERPNLTRPPSRRASSRWKPAGGGAFEIPRPAPAGNSVGPADGDFDPAGRTPQAFGRSAIDTETREGSSWDPEPPWRDQRSTGVARARADCGFARVQPTLLEICRCSQSVPGDSAHLPPQRCRPARRLESRPRRGGRHRGRLNSPRGHRGQAVAERGEMGRDLLSIIDSTTSGGGR